MPDYTNKRPKGPAMYDNDIYRIAGIDPKTGLPTRLLGDSKLKESVKRQLRIIDEENAVNRFTWSNLPCNISGQELERHLYYRGQLCFFYDATTEMFYFMPYALDGSLDFYGRYTHIRPIPFCEPGENASKEEKKAYAQMNAYLSTKHLQVLYDIPDKPIEDLESVCLLLHDYSKQRSELIIPRQQINDDLLDVMADCIPFMRTNLLNSTGITGVVVNSPDEAAHVALASKSVNDAALRGEKYIALMGSVNTKDLTGGNLAKSEEFLLAMQGLDNYRLSLYGLDNGGIFQKRSGMLQEEAEMNQGNVGLVLQDCLQIRQNFCDMANLIWILPYGGLPVWCDVSETVIGMDMNGDGIAGGDEGGNSTGTTSTDNGGNEDAE